MASICLGTAQFGLDYGISNTKGKPAREDIFTILREASRLGIRSLDTASAYGDSETKLGDFFHETKTRFRTITKIGFESKVDVLPCFLKSLSRLRQPSIYGCLIHDYENFSRDPSVWNEFCALRNEKKTEKIGFSLYYPSQLEDLLALKLNFDLVQLPYNIFDRRFESYFPKLKARGVEIHARSPFLQGVIFLEVLPTHLKLLAPKIKRLHEIAKSFSVSASSICLNFPLSHDFIDEVVLGVSNVEDLKQNVRESGQAVLSAPDLNDLREENEDLLVPARWPAHTRLEISK